MGEQKQIKNKANGKIKDKNVSHKGEDEFPWKGMKTASMAILTIVGLTGAIAVTAAVPNIFIALNAVAKLHGKTDYTDKKLKRDMQRSVYYLKKSKYIRMKQDGGIVKMWLTNLGRKRLIQQNLDNLSIVKPHVWDKTFWLVGADIPTKTHKKAADMLRWKLKAMNFFPLQRTLWVYPYKPTEALQRIVDHYQIERFVTAMQVLQLDTSDHDAAIKFFKDKNIL